jgi:hypothetical protein
VSFHAFWTNPATRERLYLHGATTGHYWDRDSHGAVPFVSEDMAWHYVQAMQETGRLRCGPIGVEPRRRTLGLKAAASD